MSWRPGWGDFPPGLLEFWTERQLCTLTTLYADGRPHVVAVGVALDHEQQCGWVITRGGSVKAKHAARDPRVAAGSVDGGRWSSLEGRAEVVTDREGVARAERMYAARYRTPSENPERVALRITVDRFLASRSLLER
ncbi:TIGR03618 family F420-dependent PPOX class oxidoreductase [Nocardioides sp. CFH 31398]|uniref:pyridoxamine 5'-phosphate oxidase family protein n=1 Tax=Nocardioides sp. CFH 31398 TaxID=2919579 RepID=UPI001F05A3C6|nr:TIGR03618 family F420-dependent PPOX class oxidoreductase [Nocardioides sp. CFH 31398]MCH1865341.1 TIGR03618 family F420-dependent PPOX class oxidoreductase [Nocardioides sp. CFH 31398]